MSKLLGRIIFFWLNDDTLISVYVNRYLNRLNFPNHLTEAQECSKRHQLISLHPSMVSFKKIERVTNKLLYQSYLYP